MVSTEARFSMCWAAHSFAHDLADDLARDRRAAVADERHAAIVRDWSVRAVRAVRAVRGCLAEGEGWGWATARR
jgi:hypothetical protein